MFDVRNGYVIEANDPTIAYINGKNFIENNGILYIDENNRSVKEVRRLIINIANPLYCAIPQIKPYPGAPFWTDPVKLNNYVQDDWIRQDNPHDNIYTYGQYIKDSGLNYVVDCLKRCISTRRAVISTWRELSEPPCLNRLQFWIRNGRLDLDADFRSLDVAGAMIADIAGLKAIIKIVKIALEFEGIYVDYGRLSISAGSGHIYVR